jgi:16S rRNA (guanine527-N7)-methyltransferase
LAGVTVAERCRELTDRFELPPRSAEKLNALLKFVITGPSSLTNVRDPAAAVELHIADSLAGLELPQLRAATTIADLGSGGGFPGLVLAIALPETELTLVESAARKADFLSETAEAMTLENVAVIAERAELWALEAREQDVVTSRALASTSILLEYAAPLLRVGGTLVAWKGSLSEEELSDSAFAAAELQMSEPRVLSVSEDLVRGADSRQLIVSEKMATTPERYPRRPGIAKKRPLAAK